MVKKQKQNSLIKLLILLLALPLTGYLAITWLMYEFEFPGTPNRIEENYRGTVGIPTQSRKIYEWCVETYGEPDNLEITEPDDTRTWYRIYADFGLLSFLFNADEAMIDDRSQWEYCSVTTCDPSHRFGLLGVHVGSPRWLVRLAYLRSNGVIRNEHEDQFLDGYSWADFVVYTYDENNIVTSIAFNYSM